MYCRIVMLVDSWCLASICDIVHSVNCTELNRKVPCETIEDLLLFETFCDMTNVWNKTDGIYSPFCVESHYGS